MVVVCLSTQLDNECCAEEVKGKVSLGREGGVVCDDVVGGGDGGSGGFCCCCEGCVGGCSCPFLVKKATR